MDEVGETMRQPEISREDQRIVWPATLVKTVEMCVSKRVANRIVIAELYHNGLYQRHPHLGSVRDWQFIAIIQTSKERK